MIILKTPNFVHHLLSTCQQIMRTHSVVTNETPLVLILFTADPLRIPVSIRSSPPYSCAVQPLPV